MKAAKILKEKINSPQFTLGILATYHCWPGLVEVVKKGGFDFLIIDFEHGPFDAEMATQACTIGRLADFPVLIRPPAIDTAMMHLILDAGAVGMLLPYVETTEEMDRVAEAIYLPPRGKRRPGGAGVHWLTDYHYANWKNEVEDDIIILPQIESRRGLENVAAIAAHPVTTAIAAGPYDLSADLGHCWDPSHPELIAAIEKIRKAGKKAGKNIWMNGNGDDLKERGFTFFCASEPILLLQNSLSEISQRLRTGADPSGTTGEQLLS